MASAPALPGRSAQAIKRLPPRVPRHETRRPAPLRLIPECSAACQASAPARGSHATPYPLHKRRSLRPPSHLGARLGLNRPFATIEEHDEALIARWNEAVGPDDVVWHLGDFCHRCPEDRARAIFSRLNGRRRFLIRGNHDRIGARLPWDGIFDVARVLVPLPAGAVQGVWCSHWAYRVWPQMHRGDIHPYGHSHGRLPGTATSTDVAVDCLDFGPVTLDKIRVRLAENAAGAAASLSGACS